MIHRSASPGLALLAIAVLLCLGQSAGTQDTAEPLFADSFDTDGAPDAPWQIVSGKWEVRDGRLCSEGNGILALSGSSFAECAIECTIRFEEAREPSRWLAIMYRGLPGGAPPYAQFALRQASTRPSGLEFAVRTAEEQWSVRARSTAPDPGTPIGEDQRLRVEFFGSYVREFLNGELVIEGDLLHGADGGSLGLQTNGVTATFDDYVVMPLGAEQRVAPPSPPSRPVVVAHRGASAYAPENTLASVRLAIEMGADGVEHDVCVTSDGVPVLMHDLTLDRTTTGTGKVSDHALAEIREMRITGPHAEDYPDEPIPTLEEALEVMKGKTIPVIEVKEADTGAAVVEAIRNVGMIDDVLVISFKDPLLAEIEAIEPRIPTAWLTGGRVQGEPHAFALSLLQRARACGANCVNMNAGLASPEVVWALHSRGMSAWVWTVNDPQMMRHLIDMEIDGITTDRPDVLVGLRAEMAQSDAE